MYPASSECDYSMMCASSSNLFGCIGLKKKKYCILNKQYTEEEYKQIFPKIVKQMNEIPYRSLHGQEYRYGEFFPPEFSPFAYNETLLQDFFPLSRTEAEQKGHTWRDPLKRGYKITMFSSDLPDDIAMVDDNIINEVIECEHKGLCVENCATAFKITPQEFSFYKKFKIPLPRACFFCRHAERIKYRNPMKVWKRQCQCAGTHSKNGSYANINVSHLDHSSSQSCPNEFETSYSPERPEIVYCEQCYQAEVV